MIRTLATVIAMTLIATANAAPPENVDLNSPLSQWYRSLRTPHSDIPCCSISDCRPVQARRVEDRWEVLLGGVWRVVPVERILQRQNMDGRAIACVTSYDAIPDHGIQGFYGDIRCFVPPPET